VPAKLLTAANLAKGGESNEAVISAKLNSNHYHVRLSVFDRWD
jgi:hypothetical protein